MVGTFVFTDCDSGSLLKFRSRTRLQQHWWIGLHFRWDLGRLVLWCCRNRRYLRELRAEAITVRSFWFLKIDFKKIILLPLYNRLLTVVTFNVLSLVGASITGCIAGIIGFYIIQKFNEICYPTLLLAYDNSDEDCKYFKQLISNTE